MTTSPDDLARRAAARLAPDLGPALPALVEARLQGGAPPARYDAATAIALAALVLNAAKFAWDIHRDRRKDGAPPTPDSVARQLRLSLRIEGVTEAQRDRVIAVVVEEAGKEDGKEPGSKAS
ncbi:hypothetical protein [Methylobacterium nonmethylotrophicum]|uniref:Uncharacterized protein n=1 Tax=Methylobacterium nonmethylotrophicum TaxID=1141884 RepID=A0A4Z0NNW4_9HYPH|nr:hypothetical protein [Methylobacterium nonmethylotrophicum]TGD98387.1 hypothetical protein EU555_16965 [Methylobacterium nonmethylotrophicum]